jgi:aminoglycoside/choline kinase family phosphotransferase
MSDFRQRLENFLSNRNQTSRIEQLTPDASTREYFRIDWNGDTAIACVYPEAFVESEQTYLDVTNLFRSVGLPVAQIYDFDEKLGVIVQEDLGDEILRDVLPTLPESERAARLDEAISLIARIQAATPKAIELNSIASRLRFDEEKLMWELDFFKTHYFETYKKQPLSPKDDQALTDEFRQLSKILSDRATVLCHRDFHAANLMIDPAGNLRIIDHQDARIGSVAYDLVSLLLDRITEPPTAGWLAEKRSYFLSERERLGLVGIDGTAFANEFRLQTIQRCLKATGTFSYQSVVRGKSYFVPFIKPMFEIVFRALRNLDRFPVMTRIVAGELAD